MKYEYLCAIALIAVIVVPITLGLVRALEWMHWRVYMRKDLVKE